MIKGPFNSLYKPWRYPTRPLKKQVPKGKECVVCGNTGRVYRAYVEPAVAQQYCKDLVPCPKCAKLNS